MLIYIRREGRGVCPNPRMKIPTALLGGRVTKSCSYKTADEYDAQITGNRINDLKFPEGHPPPNSPKLHVHSVLIFALSQLYTALHGPCHLRKIFGNGLLGDKAVNLFDIPFSSNIFKTAKLNFWRCLLSFTVILLIGICFISNLHLV